MPLDERKAVNIAFNRGTNDLAQSDTPANLSTAISSVPLSDLATSLEDLSPDSDRFFRCMTVCSSPVQPFLEANAGKWVNYARNLASLLAGKGIRMPLIATRDYQVINGIGRLQYTAERGENNIPVVFVDDHEAAFARAMLNWLSMDFDIHSRYQDLLRYNSFRRARRTRRELGRGMIFAVAGSTRASRFDVTTPANRSKWIRQHGSSVLDFGAGHLTETEILRSIGVRVTPFEPFSLGAGDTIDKVESLRCVEAFLVDVANGVTWSSVFISSVLNSVPFAEDRSHIACLCAALCSPKSVLYAVASCRTHRSWMNVIGSDSLAERRSHERVFKLEYEHGITIGDFSSKPKIQKYHTQEEFYDLFKPYFEIVHVSEACDNVQAICTRPCAVDANRLLSAIQFEFDLPYPDGTRMGMVEAARQAFSKRLQVTMNSFQEVA